MSELDFSIVANNNDTVSIYLYDKDDAPVVVTPLTLKWQMFYPDGRVIMTKTSTGTIAKVTDPDLTRNPTGIINGMAIPILPADTIGVPQGNYVHEAVAVDGSGNVVTVTDNDPILSYGTAFIRRQFTVQS